MINRDQMKTWLKIYHNDSWADNLLAEKMSNRIENNRNDRIYQCLRIACVLTIFAKLAI